MKKIFGSVIALAVLFVSACGSESTDAKQAAAQAQALEQAHMQIGMPAIGNFSEKRMMKDLYELRDKPFPTHTYIVNEQTGCLMYLGPSVGYGLPYATQYTSPTKWGYVGNGAYDKSPQAEPNGLFMPTSAEGTWIMLKDPNGPDVKPVYVEPRVVVSPFRVTTGECSERPHSAMQAPKEK
jgi:hypothetical protein